MQRPIRRIMAVTTLTVASTTATPTLGENPDGPSAGAPTVISLDDILTSLPAEQLERGQPLIIPMPASGAMQSALAINLDRIDDPAARSSHLPDILSFIGWNSGTGSFTGGPPATRLDAQPFFGFNDPFPYAIEIGAFDIEPQPVASSWDLGLGNISSFDPLFAAYFAAHPNSLVAWGWVTTGEANVAPALEAQTTFFDTLPRTLRSINFQGDFSQYAIAVTGSPFIGDGALGWGISGVTQRDCNQNGQADVLDASMGTSEDLDADQIPDECQAYEFNFDFSTFSGQVASTAEGPFAQPGFWMGYGSFPPAGVRGPIVNLGEHTTGTSIEAIFHGSASFTVQNGFAIDPPPDLAPLLRDGYRINLPSPGDMLEIRFHDVAPGDYLVVPIGVDPQDAIGSDSTYRIDSGPEQIITGAWTGELLNGEVFSSHVSVGNSGQFSLFISSGDGEAWINGLQVVERPVLDLNRNFLDDDDEIAAAPSLDVDLNGLLDVAEAGWNLVQVNWEDELGQVTPDTNLFLLEGVVPTAPEAPVRYLNTLINDEWVVQNQPIFPLEDEGAPETVSIPMQIGVNGDRLPGGDVWIDLTPFPVPEPVFNLPYVDTFDSWTTDSPGLASVDVPFNLVFPGADPMNDPGVLEPGATVDVVSRTGVPGVNEGINECVPGAFARSIAWMNDCYFLADASKSDADLLLSQLKTSMYMDTSAANGTFWNNSVTGVRAWIADMGLDEKLTVDHINGFSLLPAYPGLILPGDIVRAPTAADIEAGLCQGYDTIVEYGFYDANDQRTGGHAVTAVGMSTTRNIAGDAIRRTLIYRDEGGRNAQGDGVADVGTSRSDLDLRADGFWGLKAFGVNSTRIERVIYVCPRKLDHLEAVDQWIGFRVLAALNEVLMGGPVPDDAARAEILRDACKGLDAAKALQKRVDAGNDAAAKTAAADLVGNLGSVKAAVEFWRYDPTTELADIAVGLIETGFFSAVNDLRARFDCNSNGLDDTYDGGCCPADLTGDGKVDGADLGILLSAWNATTGDLNGDGTTDGADLGILLGAWGPCP